MAWVGLIASAAQLGIGLAEKSKAKKDAAKALGQRRAYQTPDEIYKQVQAAQNNAQTGFDAGTMQYATNETDRAFDASLQTAEKLGGDPNNLSAIFNDKINNIMGIANQSHAVKMQNFDKFLGALGTLGQSKDAEFFSQQNMVKDAQQAAAYDKQVANAQIGEGLSTGLAAGAAMAEGSLFSDTNNESKLNTALFKKEYGKQGSNVAKYAKKNGLSYSGYNQSFNNF